MRSSAVEHLTFNQEVPGSIPGAPTNEIKCLGDDRRLVVSARVSPGYHEVSIADPRRTRASKAWIVVRHPIYEPMIERLTVIGGIREFWDLNAGISAAKARGSANAVWLNCGLPVAGKFTLSLSCWHPSLVSRSPRGSGARRDATIGEAKATDRSSLGSFLALNRSENQIHPGPRTISMPPGAISTLGGL